MLKKKVINLFFFLYFYLFFPYYIYNINIIKALLKLNPLERLNAKEALNHPYFDGLREQDRKISVKDNNE